MNSAPPQNVADEPLQDYYTKRQFNGPQPVSQAWVDQHDAHQSRTLAVLGVSEDDYVDYLPGSAGSWLLKTNEYVSFWDEANTIIQIYGIRSCCLFLVFLQEL